MNILDLIIIVPIVIAFILGYKDGFINKLIGFVGFNLAIILGIVLAQPFGHFISMIFSTSADYSSLIGGTVLFFLILILTAIAKRIFKIRDEVNAMFNRIAGGAVGIFQTLFFLSAAFFIANLINYPNQNIRKSSLFYSSVVKIMPKTVDLFTTYSPKAKEKINEYMPKKDTLK